MIARITGTVTIWTGCAVALLLCAWPLAGPTAGSWCGTPAIAAFAPVPAVDAVGQDAHDVAVMCQHVGVSHVAGAGAITVVSVIAGITMLAVGGDAEERRRAAANAAWRANSRPPDWRG